MKTPRRSPAGGCFVHGQFYRGGQFLPVTGDVVSFDECAITAELAQVTFRDDVYRRSMTAILGGSKAIRHRQVLRSRRLRAITHLVEAADAAGDRRARRRLFDIHQHTLQGTLALAGC
jgi:hypothetical protein